MYAKSEFDHGHFFLPFTEGQKEFHYHAYMYAFSSCNDGFGLSIFVSTLFFNLYFFYYLFNFFTEIIKFLHYKLHLQVIYIFYLQQLRKKKPTPSHLLPKVINDPKKCDMYKLENSPLTCFYDNSQKFIKLIF